MKSKKKTGLKTIGTTGVLALLVLLGADNFGFDGFNFNFDLNKSNNSIESSESTETNAEETFYINIVVKDDLLYLNDEEMGFDELKNTLTEYPNDEYIIYLVDDWAVNSTFMKVENYLEEANYKVIISEVVESN